MRSVANAPPALTSLGALVRVSQARVNVGVKVAAGVGVAVADGAGMGVGVGTAAAGVSVGSVAQMDSSVAPGVGNGVNVGAGVGVAVGVGKSVGSGNPGSNLKTAPGSSSSVKPRPSITTMSWLPGRFSTSKTLVGSSVTLVRAPVGNRAMKSPPRETSTGPE